MLLIAASAAAVALLGSVGGAQAIPAGAGGVLAAAGQTGLTENVVLVCRRVCNDGFCRRRCWDRPGRAYRSYDYDDDYAPRSYYGGPRYYDPGPGVGIYGPGVGIRVGPGW